MQSVQNAIHRNALKFSVGLVVNIAGAIALIGQI